MKIKITQNKIAYLLYMCYTSKYRCYIGTSAISIFEFMFKYPDMSDLDVLFIERKMESLNYNNLRTTIK